MESMVQKMRKMKDSGIEWIGEIPEGWEISKVSYFYEVQLGKMLQPQKKSETDTEEKYLCAANVGKSSLSLDTLKTMWFSQTEKHQFDLKEGDLLVVEGGDVASCAIIETPIRNLFFQNALHRVRPLHNESVAFLRYWLMTAKSYGYIDLICNKATIAHFSKEKFIALPILVIPQDIQSKIVSFLDLECKQIDDLLSKSRSSIEEYKKLKQAVITQAVTKGVRGEREMKDSGVAWIGKIPTTYSICKLKYLLKNPLKYGANESGIPYSDSLPRYIRITDITPDGNLKCTGKLSLSEESAKDYILEDGDILFARSGATVGKTFIYCQSYGRSAYAGYLIKASLNNKVSPKFVYYYTCSSLYEIWKNSIFIQSTIQNIGADRYANLPVPVPMTLQEQEEIADYLDAKCAEIDKLIAKKEQLLKELESYKKSLIYEVVTGKREV